MNIFARLVYYKLNVKVYVKSYKIIVIYIRCINMGIINCFVCPYVMSGCNRKFKEHIIDIVCQKCLSKIRCKHIGCRALIVGQPGELCQLIDNQFKLEQCREEQRKAEFK